MNQSLNLLCKLDVLLFATLQCIFTDFKTLTNTMFQIVCAEPPAINNANHDWDGTVYDTGGTIL